MKGADLNESGTVVLNGSGAGTAKVGPLTAREQWHPQNVAVSATSATNEAECIIYVGDDNTRRLRDTTVNASSGDATDKCNGDTIKKGMYVWAVWTGGDAGAVATVTVTGTKDV